MIDLLKLNTVFKNLQDSSINCGGHWEANVYYKNDSLENSIEVLQRIFISENKYAVKYDNFEQYQEFLNEEWNPYEQLLTRNIQLIGLINWKDYFNKRLEYWSNFELISKEEMKLIFNEKVFLANKLIFISELEKIIDLNLLLKVSIINIDKFDTYYLWRHQIQEDFILEFDNFILTINFGWSS